jgi:hypothetical protein
LLGPSFPSRRSSDLLAGRDQWPAVFAALRGEPVDVHFDAPRDPVWEGDEEGDS